MRVVWVSFAALRKTPAGVTSDLASVRYRITLPHLEAATFDAALASHRDALFAEYKADHADNDSGSEQRPPLPTTGEAFMRLVEAGCGAVARTHGRTRRLVVV